MNNLSKITNNDDSVECFAYDQNNNVIEDTYKEHKITNVYQNNTKIITTYDFDNENYRNFVTNSNENVNSEIVNGILTNLAASTNYVGLFDKTIQYNKSTSDFINNVTRYCSLLSSFYDGDYEIPVEIVGQGNVQPQRVSEGLTYCVVSNQRYIKYTRPNISKLSGAFGGSIGSLYSILRMDSYVNFKQ